MISYTFHRSVHSLIVIVGVVTLIFVMLRVVPGDPVLLLLGPDADREQVAAVRRARGFDQPIPVQYVRYIGAITRGDFGTSVTYGRPALELVLDQLPATVVLALAALLITLTIAFPLGILAALRRGTWMDYAVTAGSLIGQSVPTFWLGIMLILVLSRTLRWLPAIGGETQQGLIMPSIALGVAYTALLLRLIRSGLLEVLNQPYIRTARAKRLSSRRVMLMHAVPNMLVPVITVIGLQLGTLLSGAVITETVFARPGVGSLLITAIDQRDYTLVQACMAVIAFIIVATNLAVDLAYGFLDPRIRLKGGR